MEIRLGYVAMSLEVENCSPSKTITLKSLEKLANRESQLYHLKKLTETNLKNTLRLLYHNSSLGINVYRFTSKLVPMATHPISEDFDYIGEFKDLFEKIGDYVKEKKFRVSAHPDHFTILNTPNPDVLAVSLKDLDYHHRVFEAMGLDSRAKLVLHLGGSYGNKEKAKERFIDNFKKLPTDIADRIILENDDKSYNTNEVLEICKHLKVPMVLDYHHHLCNKGDTDLENLIIDIFETWEDDIPKVHMSSPKNEKQYRHHAEFIDIDQFLALLSIVEGKASKLDVMVEAKGKDKALIKLLDDLQKVNGILVGPGAKFNI